MGRYNNDGGREEDWRDVNDSFAYQNKVRELKERGTEVYEDSRSGHAFTSRSTILPDGTEVMDM